MITLRDDVHRLGLFVPEVFLQVMREVGFKTTEAYSDWTFRKGSNTTAFKDTIFVGRKRA